MCGSCCRRALRSELLSSAEVQIHDFVQTPENWKLRAATGSYSTPFRGLLFGEKNADKVEQQLLTRNVDVLWLGSNPSVKTGLDRILDTHSDDSHFKTFIAQMESGLFSQHAVDAGASITWNPLQKSNHKWELYRDAISNSAGININAVAMANFIPWGSPNMEKLAVGVSGTDPRLWNRMLEFSNHLNIQIVEKLKPKLLIVPRSLGDTSAKAPKFLRGLGIVNEEARNLRPGCGRFGVGMQPLLDGRLREGPRRGARGLLESP